MRILIFHNQLWAHYKSKLFTEIQAVLKEKSPESKLQVCHIAEYESIRNSMLDSKKMPYDYPYNVLFEGSLEKVGFLSRLMALWKCFHQFKPEVLNITGYFDYAQVIMMFYARWFYQIPVVISSESSVADHSRSKFKEIIKSVIIKQAKAYFCFGKTSAQYLLELGAQSNQIAVSNAAVVDDETIAENFKASLVQNNHDSRNNFIYVGRLAEEKNLTLLLEAFDQIKKNNPNAKDWGLLLVGDGPEKAALTSMVEDQQIENVKFVGGYPWYEVPAFFAQSSVAILPSLSEPWGLVVNEAMICELPVIVSDRCGCVPDLVFNGENGFVFNAENQQDLSQRLDYFVNNPASIETMGKRSASIVSGFSANQVAQRMVECYQKLCREA